MKTIAADDSDFTDGESAQKDTKITKGLDREAGSVSTVPGYTGLRGWRLVFDPRKPARNGLYGFSNAKFKRQN
jgi:hypothetical protein